MLGKERHYGCGLEVGNHAHADTTRSSATLFDGYEDKSCPPMFKLPASPESSLFTANPRLIHLYLSAQRFPSRVHHCPAQLVQHHPCGLVAGQAQLTLQK
jgi:hypothetical protein